MNISKKAIFLLLFVVGTVFSGEAQRRPVRQTLEEYVNRYHSIAVAHMERYGIPASITLAQGILESDCGNSELSRSSNNHFGIKCKRDWTGDRVYHDDDAKGECFRAYPTVEASYEDHAEFLDRQPRYDSLFNYAPTDYKSWARGLKAAGYATAPDYALRLVRLIENNRLYLFDREGGELLYAGAGGAESRFADQSSVGEIAPAAGVDPDNYRVTINARNGYNVYRTNGVCYVLAGERDSFENIGRQFRISARNLRKFNDVSGDAQPLTGEVVYIERKKNRWEGNARLHTAVEGETLYSVAQSYAVRLKSLRKINRLKRDDVQFAAGEQVKIKR